MGPNQVPNTFSLNNLRFRSILVTWISGIAGGVVGGFAGGYLALLFLDSDWSADGFEGMGQGIMIFAGCILFGTAVLVWVALSVFGFSKPGVTALLYTVLSAFLIPMVAAFGAMLVPDSFNLDELAVVVVGGLGSFLAAWVTRMVTHRDPSPG